MACGLIVGVCGCDTSNSTAPNDQDNTAINERDADGNTVTPLDQSNEQSDIELVAAIREKVLEIENLSLNGRNVKIITNEGKVVLRGPVENETERDAIVTVAKEKAGNDNIINLLEVKAN